MKDKDEQGMASGLIFHITLLILSLGKVLTILALTLLVFIA